mgnify:CR=1 FL=1
MLEAWRNCTENGGMIMASKTYIVMKNGEEIEKLKTLGAAKELADAEGAEVYCGEKCVYQGKNVSSESTVETGKTGVADKAAADDMAGTPASETQASDKPAETAEEPDDKGTAEVQEETVGEKTIITAEPVVAKKPAQIKTEPVETVRYRLKSLMNIRKRPSLDAQIVGTKAEGTVVRTVGIEDDWLHLSDGNYVLYGGGEYAVKVEE